MKSLIQLHFSRRLFTTHPRVCCVKVSTCWHAARSSFRTYPLPRAGCQILCASLRNRRSYKHYTARPHGQSSSARLIRVGNSTVALAAGSRTLALLRTCLQQTSFDMLPPPFFPSANTHSTPPHLCRPNSPSHAIFHQRYLLFGFAFGNHPGQGGPGNHAP